MRRLEFEKAAVVVSVILLVLLMSGCIVIKDSPAPGCVKTIGFPLLGGCFGKTAILDLTVEPENECLVVTVNNCNGGVLEVHNTCNEMLVLGGVEIPPSGHVSLDVIEEENDEYLLREVSRNFSDYVPEADKRIEIAGTLGSQDVEVAFTKTAELCE